MTITDAMHLKSLRPECRNEMARYNRRRRNLLENLAKVVRENIGTASARGERTSPQTVRLDKIRAALSELDQAMFKDQWQEIPQPAKCE
jgi:hypothetical protein